MTYFLLFRHAHLVLSNITAHPEARHPAFRAAIEKNKTEVNKNFKVLEALKGKLNERYERYQSIIKDREARRRAQQRSMSSSGSLEQHESRLVRQHPVQLQPGEHMDLAKRLAAEAFAEHSAFHSLSAQPTQSDGDDLTHHMQGIRVQLDPGSQRSQTRSRRQEQSSSSTPIYHYPSVPSKHARSDQTAVDFQESLPLRAILQPTMPPALPPKPGTNTRFEPPARPDKIPDHGMPTSTTPPPMQAFQASRTLENGTPLRTVYLPSGLRESFLSKASSNTRKNLETCAFLCGKVKRNAVFVTALVFPAQEATSDTCEMTDEEALFNYCEKEDVETFGWIHTHPTQTCFMSSRDLHTHAGFQQMTAEFIAIVCAPSQGNTEYGRDWGIYRLTDPPGRAAILACDNPGIFHLHETENLYTDAWSGAGHVLELPNASFKVADLRTT